MFHKLLIPLFMLIGLFLLASCSPKPESQTASPNIANPASVHCDQNGGKLELRTDTTGGVAGICIFPDGSECDEWAYFRGECKPGDSLARAKSSAAPTKVLRIVYFKDGQVMMWTEGKGPQTLVEAGVESLRISDDGQVVAYLGSDSAGVHGLYGLNAEDTNPSLLVSQDYLQNISPASQIVFFDFAPGTHMLYFVTDSYDLQRVDLTSTSPEPIFATGKGGFFRFSPDGRWMTLYHPNELVLAHPDGTEARIAFQYPADFSYSMMGPEVAWKVDSSGLSIVSASGPQGEADSMAVWFIPVVGQAVKLMSYAGPYGASLAPDGSTVVYLNFQHEPVEVHIVNRDGKDIIYASFATKTYPAIDFMGWAPDSKSFLLNLSKDGRLKDPYLCAVDKSPVKLTDSADAYPVSWVDAERILFVSDGNLHLQKNGEPSIILDAVSDSDFDFSILSP